MKKLLLVSFVTAVFIVVCAQLAENMPDLRGVADRIIRTGPLPVDLEIAGGTSLSFSMEQSDGARAVSAVRSFRLPGRVAEAIDREGAAYLDGFRTAGTGDVQRRFDWEKTPIPGGTASTSVEAWLHRHGVEIDIDPDLGDAVAAAATSPGNWFAVVDDDTYFIAVPPTKTLYTLVSKRDVGE